MAKDPSIDFLCECLSYNPVTGILVWIPRPRSHFTTDRAFNTWHSRFCGKAAGGLNSKGYIEIGMLGRLVKAHRAAWAIYYGKFPDADIDHINGVRDDNRIANLRSVTRKSNCRNSAIHRNNRSGISGVRWRERDNRWVAEINFDGMQRHLGHYQCLIDAAAARKSAELKYGYHENHGRTPK